MPIDIAASLTPTYDSQVPVPADGEYANHASLAAMSAALGNRIEYLREQFEGKPWNAPRLAEDWVSFYHDTAAGRVHGDSGVWSYDESGAGFGLAAGTSSDPTDFGVLLAQNSTGNALSMRLRKLGGTRLANLRQFAFRIDLVSTLNNKEFEFGVFDDGSTVAIGSGTTSGLGISYRPSLSPNIRTLGVSGGTYTYTDTGIAMTTDPTTIDLVWTGSVWLASIDGAGSFSFSGLPATTSIVIPQFRLGSTNSGTRSFLIDAVYARWETART